MTAPMDIKEAAKVLRRHNEWRRGVRGADDNHWQQSQYSPTELGHAIDAAVVALEGMDTITERARELIGLHLSEQEGLHLPTGREYQRAVDALAQAIGASHQHPRERALHQDAKRGNFRYQQEDDGA